MRNLKLLFYIVCKLTGLFRAARWLTRKQLRILCYHGFALADEASFRPALFVHPERFAERLGTIKRYGYQVLPLGDAISMLYGGTLPPHSAVITVDDGFHTVHRLAVPLLKHYSFPATVYVTTYYVQHANPIFRLVVQYMFWKTRKGTLSLANVPWSTDRNVDLSDPDETGRAMWDCINYGERNCTEEMRCAMCRELGELLDVSYGEITRSRMLSLMTPDELRSLSAAKMDVQLHTHRHTFPMDDRAAAEREISENRAALEGWLDRTADHFCYPSGIWHQRQWQWLDGMQVKSSTTCIPGLNSKSTPRHALRRFLDSENVHQLEFEAHLSGFVPLLRSLMPLRREPAA